MRRTVQVNGEAIFKSMDMINRNSTYKNPGWFLRKAEHGYFNLTYEMAEKFEDMRIILDNMYGENWQFFFTSKTCLPRLYIKYPEIKITNSEGAEHTIRDLIISVFMDRENSKINLRENIRAVRLTVTKEEFISKYLHSHLPNKSFRDYISPIIEPINIAYGNSFCLGENEVPEVAAIFNDNQNVGTFELFLMTLNAMVEWESLEGVPHIKIKHISSKTYNNDSVYFVGNSYIEILFKIISKKDFLKELDFDMDRNRIKVIENDFFQEGLLKRVSQSYRDLLCKREGDKYFKIYTSEIPNPESINANFLFKNELIPFKIYNSKIEENQEEEDETSFQVHPIVYREAVKKLNNYLYEKSIEYYTRTTTR